MDKTKLLAEWNSVKGDRQFQLLQSLSDKNFTDVIAEATLLSQLNQIVHDAISKLP